MSMKTAVRQLSRWIRRSNNAIIVSGNCNEHISEAYIDSMLPHFEKEIFWLFKMEINNLHLIIEKLKAAGLIIVFNPSPYNHVIETLPMDKIDYLFINEVEGQTAERF